MKLRIEKAIYGGDGLARVPEGKTVFVPGTLPGELVEATIVADKRSFATGALGQSSRCLRSALSPDANMCPGVVAASTSMQALRFSCR